MRTIELTLAAALVSAWGGAGLPVLSARGAEAPAGASHAGLSFEDRLRAAGLADESRGGRIQSIPTKEFWPRTLTDSPQRARMEVDSAIEQLRSGSASDLKGNTRAPSSELKVFLRETRVREPIVTPPAVQPPKRTPGTNKAGAAGEAQEIKGERFALYAVAKRRQPEGKLVGGSAPPMVIFNQSPDFDFATIEGAGAPFYVFDVDPAETILVELSGDEVARVRKQGKDWAWIQLDSGLMGLVRNHHVKAAGEYEILKYLALEYGKMRQDGSAPQGDERVRVNKVNGAYQVATITGKDVPVPAIGNVPEDKSREPAVIEAMGEYEILKNLALHYRKGGREGSEQEGPVKVNRVNGQYQITGPDGKAVPLPPLGEDEEVQATAPK